MRKDLQNIIGPITFEDYFKEYFIGFRGYIEEKLNKSMRHIKKNIVGFESKETDNSILELATGEEVTFGINTINNRNSITDFRKNWGIRYGVKLEDTNNIKKSIERAVYGLTDEEYISNYIDNNLGRTVKKANAKNIDLSPKYINKTEQFFTAKAKELYRGKMSDKQIAKYNKAVESLQNNNHIQKILNFDGPNKAISFIDDLVKKPFSKAFNISKKVLGSDITQKIATNSSKAFTFIGAGMNAYTMANDNSDFKKVMAGLDLFGDGIGMTITAATGGVGAPLGGLISGIASGISFVGTTAYDILNSKENGWGKDIVGALDNGAGYIVRPIQAKINEIKKNPLKAFAKLSASVLFPGSYYTYKVAKMMDAKLFNNKYGNQLKNAKKRSFDFIKSMKEKLLNNGMNNSFDFKNGLENTIKGRTRGIGIKVQDKPTEKLIRGVKFKQSKPYGNVIDMYHNDTKDIKTNNFKIRYDREILDTKLLEGQRNSSNRNNFTININAQGFSFDEVANQLASKIQTTMANVYA